MSKRNFKGDINVGNNADVQNELGLPSETTERALELDASGKVKSSSVTSTELGHLSGVTSGIQSQLDAKQETSEKGNANGYASLDGSGKVPVTQLPNAIMEYQGVWNASTNTPTLADGGGNADEAIGDVYRVGTAGTQDLGSGSITFGVGDYVILNSSKIWEKADNTDAVSSVFGRQGVVTAQSSDYDANQVDYDNSTSGFTATDVQAAIDEQKTNVDGKQDDVITTRGDLVVGNASNEESRLPIGSNGQVLQSDGTDVSWANIATADEQVKISANDTTTGYLEDKVTSNDSSITVSTLNDGGDEDLNVVVNPANVDHDSLQNFVANEHIDHTSVEVATAATSGLAGGGDLTTTRNIVVDPTAATAETVNDDADLILIHDDSAAGLRKMTRGNFLSGLAETSAGDISETSFSGANNQAVAANVTGLAFANGTVRSAKVHLSIVVDATTDLYETYDLQLIQRTSDWVLTQESTGDDSEVVFTVTSAGQIQYTSGNYTGFSSLTIKFRAVTTSV